MNDFDDGPETGKETVKRKSRNLSEKKRRDQFNMLINELFSMVATSNRKMDKTTTLKTTIAFLRQHNEVTQQSHIHEVSKDWKPSFLSNDEFTQLMLESQESFVLVVSQDGTILYTSEGITSLLNQIPADIVSDSIYHHIHPDERLRVKGLLLGHNAALNSSPCDFNRSENQLSFTCHFKCGSLVPSEPPVYEMVECRGYFRKWNKAMLFMATDNDDDASLMTGGQSANQDELCYFCTVQLGSIQVIRELSHVEEGKREFTSRHSMEWKFLFLDHRGPPIIGYQPFEVLGTSGYDYYHPEDLEKVAECHEQLMQSGEGTSCFYRFLTKGQQWIWIQTHYYITYHQWSSKPEFIVCTNTVVNYTDVRSALIEQVSDDRPKEKEEWMEEVAQSPGPSAKPEPSVSLPLLQTNSRATESKIPDEQNTSLAASRPQLMRVLKEEPVITPQQPPAAAAASTVPYMVTVSHPVMTSATTNQQAPFMQYQPLFLSPAQQRLQEQLKLKHQQLQESIIHQQQELQHIWEQLMLTSRLNVPTVVNPSNMTPSPADVTPNMVMQQPDQPPIAAAPPMAAVSPMAAMPEPLLMPIPFFSQVPNPQQQQQQQQQFIIPAVQSPVVVSSVMSPSVGNHPNSMPHTPQASPAMVLRQSPMSIHSPQMVATQSNLLQSQAPTKQHNLSDA